MAYAQSLGKGWRLPTIQELYTAYVEKVPGFYEDVYWSMSSLENKVEYKWFLNFAIGYADVNLERYQQFFRCVKDNN